MNLTPQDIINENLERRKALATRAQAYNPIVKIALKYNTCKPACFKMNL